MQPPTDPRGCGLLAGDAPKLVVLERHDPLRIEMGDADRALFEEGLVEHLALEERRRHLILLRHVQKDGADLVLAVGPVEMDRRPAHRACDVAEAEARFCFALAKRGAERPRQPVPVLRMRDLQPQGAADHRGRRMAGETSGFLVGEAERAVRPHADERHGEVPCERFEGVEAFGCSLLWLSARRAPSVRSEGVTIGGGHRAGGGESRQKYGAIRARA